MATWDEIERKVLVAFIEVESDESDSDDDHIEQISQRSGIPVGYVTQVLESYGVQMSIGGMITITPSVLNQIEAAVLMPVESAQVPAGPQYNVNAGAGSMLQVGHNVSGSQTISYSQVFEQMVETINRSNMPPAEKSAALEKLKDLLMSNGVATAFGIGAHLLQKWFSP